MNSQNLINILPPDVAAKIAAGEVVERPASVVKELLDNSIDAGADRIVVEIEDGGRSLIRVSDNGCGMNREDVRLAVERHATSKIRQAEDLDAIVTFGFRGEALASIAAVSRFEIQTRRDEDTEGTRLWMEGTVKPEIEAIGCPAGTMIAASDIYFNTPARRKFLKTAATELSHVSYMFNRAALPHHGIHFTLRHNGRDIVDYPRVESRKERLFAFLGKKAWENMRPLPKLPSTSTSEGIEIEGYLSIPTETRNRADQVFFFVNDRYVHNRMLLSAMMDAYRRLLHPGRYPTAVVFLYIDPAAIDINVHPKKQEIKFSDEQRIWRTLHGTVREALSGIEREAMGFGPEEDLAFTPSPLTKTEEQNPRGGPGISLSQPPEMSQSRGGEQTEEIKKAVNHFFEKREQEKLKGQTHQQLFSPSEKPVPLAQVLDTYLLCEQNGRLVIVDQHAAAERIRYEQLQKQMTQGAPQQQALLFPVTVEVPPGEVPKMEENISLFETLGFDIQPFGGETFVVNSMPAIHKMEECESLVLDLLKDLTGIGDSTTMDEKKQRLLVSMACHRSIRAGDRLGPEAMQDLIDQLYAAEHPFTCPHGRPTMVALDRNALERFFKRSGF